MPRDIPVGNGKMLVEFDKNYYIRELFYPYVGEENHTNGNIFRIGFFVNESFSWLEDEEWKVNKKYIEDSLVTEVSLINEKQGVEIIANDLVDFHENIYIKKMKIKSINNNNMNIKIFFTQDFDIKGNSIGDTGVYKPDEKMILHYKGDRYFGVNVAFNNEVGVLNYAIGTKDDSTGEGTWRDAEDGKLEMNPIQQGTVDSVLEIDLNIKSNNEETAYYWILAGKTWEEICKLNSLIVDKCPEELIKRTKNYWKLWTNKEELDKTAVSEKVMWLYKKSLLILRTQIDNDGGIIAANDSDVMAYNRDTYSYIWPRDGALVANALDEAGYLVLASRFYQFCADVILKDGFLLHKYTPSKNVGSSWHSWVNNGKKQLPIQEDETALVIWALWNHFSKYKDIEFIKPLYKKLIKNSGDFLLKYRDEKTKLPLASYDLWEERLGIHLFTVASVYGGLIAASNFTRVFGEVELSKKYLDAALEIKKAVKKHMYLEKEKRFVRMINFNDNGEKVIDYTLDASMYGVFAFGMFSVHDEEVVNTMEAIENKLWIKTEVGGLARYENDPYYRISDKVTGNPWFITTLWIAYYYIEKSRMKDELKKAYNIIEWVAERSLESGVLAEQVNPFNNEPLSVSPLTWSHATYIFIVKRYIEKYNKIKINDWMVKRKV